LKPRAPPPFRPFWRFGMRRSERRLVKEFIKDLEYIKTLLERYNSGEGSLADIWDYVNARLDALRED